MGYAIRFENVTKRYPRGGPRYASLRHDFAEGVRRAGRRLAGQRNEGRGPIALEDLSFEIEEGESYAIVGPNGAGKTTALKLISRISYPTSGRVKVRGRVGALIEVGSGVHPELNARENIWLYGQIMGMSKSEVKRRFDEIVEFAELGHALDRPVKMYSTGMQLRLGFAVASHLDPDIFVVDEALAVGDAGFQAKCVERMMKLVAEGRTLLFVSHNLSAVEAICERGLFLLDGKWFQEGGIKDTLHTYLKWVDEEERMRKGADRVVEGRGLKIEAVSVHAPHGEERYVLKTGDPLEIRFHIYADYPIQRPWFSVGVSDGRPGALVMCSMLEGHEGLDIDAGRQTISCKIDALPLGPRTYELWASVRERSGTADMLDWTCVGAIRMESDQIFIGSGAVTTPWLYGPVRVGHSWELLDRDD
jgi:ABC-type polysaccharide/polyol phosphate transport system ATPase subunit